jgi:hypothetical protein
MAEAAIETADWTRKTVKWAERQFYATIGEIIALVATIAIAILAVAAAFGSNRIARESAERQLRAYVNPSATRITMSANGFITVKLTYKNSGQTPAYNFVANTLVTITPQPPSSSFESPERPEPSQSASRGTVGSNSHVEREMKFPNPLTIEYQNDIAAGKAAIYAYGRITYDDIYGKGHTTRFRYIYMGPWGGQHGMQICGDGNEAD